MLDLSPLSPVSLREASETLLRGLVTPSTLKAAAERGELAVFKLGRRLVTTPQDIEEWTHKCREKRRAPGSISNQQDGMAMKQLGSSETEIEQSEQASALALARMLKSGSTNTCQKNISQNGESVHYLKLK